MFIMSDPNESEKRASSKLSDFVTKYSAEQKKEIFDKVIKGAIEAQKEVLEKANAM
ncbi:MAG: hypothetical protein ACI8WB_001459 [Phenylobacterium sp.]